MKGRSERARRRRRNESHFARQHPLDAVRTEPIERAVRSGRAGRLVCPKNGKLEIAEKGCMRVLQVEDQIERPLFGDARDRFHHACRTRTHPWIHPCTKRCHDVVGFEWRTRMKHQPSAQVDPQGEGILPGELLGDVWQRSERAGIELGETSVNQSRDAMRDRVDRMPRIERLGFARNHQLERPLFFFFSSDRSSTAGREEAQHREPEPRPVRFPLAEIVRSERGLPAGLVRRPRLGMGRAMRGVFQTVGLSAVLLVASPVWADPASGLAAPLAPSGQGVAATSAASSAQGAPEIEAAVRALANDRAFKDAKVGVTVIDVDSGRVLAAHNEHLPLNPASNAKVYTAAAALATLHGDHRFETTLSGTVKGGDVTGPLVLRGTGDPSLSTADLAQLVDEIHAMGVRRVDGDILVDQRAFDEQVVPPAFEQQPNEWASFRAPVSAVALNENTVTMTVRPGADGSPAQVAFDPPGFVDVEGTVTTAGEGADGVGLVLAPSGQRLSAKVSGKVGSDARVVRFTRRVDDPTLLAGYALKAELERAQIKVSGEVKAGSGKGAVIARHLSEPLSSLLYSVGKMSDNFYAEMIFKSIGGEGKRRPARHADAAEVVKDWVQKVGAFDQGVVIKNGSGLFDANRVTTSSLTSVLRVVWKDPALQPEFLAQLAVGGNDGTLKKRFRDDRIHHAVRAKTGTLEDAIALTGYVLGPAGKGPIAFSVVMNGTAGKAAQARSAIDKLVEMLVRRQWPKAS